MIIPFLGFGEILKITKFPILTPNNYSNPDFTPNYKLNSVQIFLTHAATFPSGKGRPTGPPRPQTSATRPGDHQDKDLDRPKSVERDPRAPLGGPSKHGQDIQIQVPRTKGTLHKGVGPDYYSNRRSSSTGFSRNMTTTRT